MTLSPQCAVSASLDRSGKLEFVIEHNFNFSLAKDVAVTNAAFSIRAAMGDSASVSSSYPDMIALTSTETILMSVTQVSPYSRRERVH